MTPLRLLPPSDFLIAGIVQDIEDADAVEMVAISGSKDIEGIMRGSRDASFECYACCYGDTPAGIFGICMENPADGSVGVPWAVFTREMRNHPRDLVKVSAAVVARWGMMFPFLNNLVDQRNTRAIHWLEMLGFSMVQTTTAPDGSPFYIFEMRNV